MADVEMTDDVPPDGCHRYTYLGEVPWDIQKYWQQRYSIFSRYDEGIWMTDDAWFGITPEPVANKIAAHLSHTTSATTIIDLFAGAGGNTIAFAQSGHWEKIIAIEKDPLAITCGKHNAEIYGVGDKIQWIEGDCFEVLQNETYFFFEFGNKCVVFASPPWGGPGYRSDEIFDLSTMQPYSVNAIYEAAVKVSPDIALYLPRTSDLRQLAKYASGDRKVEVVHYCMEGASKVGFLMSLPLCGREVADIVEALCAYLGGLSTV
ncbi:MAG: Trimethylguanosine synthase [Geoglossum umbratile]|nr:MAG: Trimethylguanosine synthase [Geoglossum umbratile]